MPPLSPMAIIQQAIMTLSTTREPLFIAHALYWLDAGAIVLIVVEALKGAGSSGSFQDRWFGFFQTLMYIVIARTMLVFYDTPLPGVGISFSNIITDESAYLVNLLDANAIERTFAHLDVIWSRMIAPSYMAWLAMLIYMALLLVMFMAKAVILVRIMGGFIAAAVCGLIGPLFIPFIVSKRMSWLFWGWFRAFIQYAMMPVIAIAVLMVFEQFIFNFSTTLPPYIEVSNYPTYLYAAIVWILVMTLGVWSIPSLAASIFSGHMDHNDGSTTVLAVLMRRK